MWDKNVEFNELLGKVFKSVENIDDTEIKFVTEDAQTYRMLHSQDCCEYVYIESVVGDLNDLVGNPILLAEEVSENDDNASESGTWTFYKLATIKGYVDIRWYGSSNGYYSESVDLYKV